MNGERTQHPYCFICGRTFEPWEDFHKLYFKGKLVPVCRDDRTCGERKERMDREFHQGHYHTERRDTKCTKDSRKRFSEHGSLQE